MNILCFLDIDRQTKISEDLRSKISSKLNNKGYPIEMVELERSDLVPCLGCLSCYTKHPGICVSNDKLIEISKKMLKDRCIIIYLTPVIFGQFSSTIKILIDRSGMYMEQFHSQIMIGYGDEIDDEEKNTFIDITLKHRGDNDIVHSDQKSQRFEVYITRSMEDNKVIIETINKLYYLWNPQ